MNVEQLIEVTNSYSLPVIPCELQGGWLLLLWGCPREPTPLKLESQGYNASTTHTQTLNGTGIFTYIWLNFMINVGKYTIHWVIWDRILWRNIFFIPNNRAANLPNQPSFMPKKGLINMELHSIYPFMDGSNTANGNVEEFHLFVGILAHLTSGWMTVV